MKLNNKKGQALVEALFMFPLVLVATFGLLRISYGYFQKVLVRELAENYFVCEWSKNFVLSNDCQAELRASLAHTQIQVLNLNRFIQNNKLVLKIQYLPLAEPYSIYFNFLSARSSPILAYEYQAEGQLYENKIAN